MNQEEAIERAKKSVHEHGLPWEEPIVVNRRKAFIFFGPVFWEILTASDKIGASVAIRIKDADGSIQINSLAR